MSTELCGSCALCCGGLFAELDLEPGEPTALQREVWERIGLQPNYAAVTPYLSLPCPALHARRCTCYAQRPRACVTFRCRLLARYESGECTWDEARELITRMEGHIQAVTMKLADHPAVSPGPFLHCLQAFRSWYRDAPPEQALQWEHVLVELQALLILLQHHFLKR